MGRLRSQDYYCECGWQDALLIELPHDVPYSIDSCPATTRCPECGADAARTFGAPATMNVALPDGTDRGDTWRLMKTEAQLKRKRKAIPPKKRGDVDAAIAEVRKDLKKHAKPDRFQSTT